MSATAPSALVALAVGETRAVVPLELTDARGLEVETTLPLRAGDTLEVQVRCVAGASRLMVELAVRIEWLRPAKVGQRARLAFARPEVPVIADVLAFAQKMGRRAPEKPAAPPAEEPVAVRATASLPTLLVDASTDGSSRLMVDEVLSGSLLVATPEPPEKNAETLVRLELPEGRVVWLCGRVVYHGQTRDGRPGVGLALEALPEGVRRDLRGLRR
ncbi:hypothetical protein L6V77_11915 [Myxococcota bacterium]|nr:hypothetical protein [Myxococcota bacterium]